MVSRVNFVMERSDLKHFRRWVVKVGSALLTDDGAGLNTQFVDRLSAQIHELRSNGIEVVLVSSGSVAAGVSQLGWTARPDKLNELQAAAAVGQASLVRQYQSSFKPHGDAIAQVLLTHADISNRERYLNARSTLLTLLSFGVVPIINENDTVATEEICFGDNDSLGALVANIVDAELLVILTDQNGLYSSDPRSNPNAELIRTGSAEDESLLELASGGSAVGRGGMITKLTAATIASRSGAHTIIASGRENHVLNRIWQGEPLGTLLESRNRVASKKQWMAGQMKVAGTFIIDQGAINVLTRHGRSLLPVGVVEVNGQFTRGALVSCVDPQGREIARGLTNYSSQEAVKIIGQSSDKIGGILGYGGEDELIHRNNMVVL